MVFEERDPLTVKFLQASLKENPEPVALIYGAGHRLSIPLACEKSGFSPAIYYKDYGDGLDRMQGEPSPFIAELGLGHASSVKREVLSELDRSQRSGNKSPEEVAGVVQGVVQVLKGTH